MKQVKVQKNTTKEGQKGDKNIQGDLMEQVKVQKTLQRKVKKVTKTYKVYTR